MSLRDLKNAAAQRRAQADAPAPKVGSAGVEPTKMLGARIPVSVHRQFQQRLLDAQEHHPDVTIQKAVPVMIRLLQDEEVWQRFLEGLAEDRG